MCGEKISMSLDDPESIDWNAIVQKRRLAGQVRTFQNNEDAGYRNWLRIHPNAFVVDADSVPPRDGMIHTLRCGHVAYGPWVDGMPLQHAFSYTSPPNVKICADSERVLLEYCRGYLPADQDIARCKTCM